MFLDSFPRDEEQDSRPMRLPRDAAGEAGKTRHAWPFPVTTVADKGFGLPHVPKAASAAVPLAPTPGPSSFVT